jgi:hypothetical protein
LVSDITLVSTLQKQKTQTKAAILAALHSQKAAILAALHSQNQSGDPRRTP